jgi:transcriptional regulator with XRE-family HTH domain
MIVVTGIENWLKEKGISKAEFARKLGISEGGLNTVLRRDSTFELKFLNKVCEITGLSVGQVITWYPDDIYDIGRAYRENDVSYEKMYAIMKERGYTEYLLAKSTGMSINYFYCMKRENRKMSIDVIKKVAEFLQVKPTDLFEIIEKPEKSEN